MKEMGEMILMIYMLHYVFAPWVAFWGHNILHLH